jgi:hypothetical protein
MDFLKEFNNLPVTTRRFIIPLIIIIPFWLVAIYLFHPDFYKKGDYLMLSAFCFCFSITWQYLHMTISMITFTREKRTGDSAGVAFVAATGSVMHLCLPMLIAYFCQLSFNIFLSIAFGWTLILFFVGVIRFEIQREKEEGKKN